VRDLAETETGRGTGVPPRSSAATRLANGIADAVAIYRSMPMIDALLPDGIWPSR
jgi:hypothetical protein